ncbi:hypothetical protein BDY24DRAFT_381974 [Mrakia frigida]|uniref:uncharacterized protein n=1 Tax=Mrakia frigida TaxID=29902 RepID=UPI003FCC1077
MKLTCLPIRSFSSTSSTLYPRKPPTAPKYALPDRPPRASSSSPSSSSLPPQASSSAGPSWYSDAPSKYTSDTPAPQQPSESLPPKPESPPTAPPAWFLPSTSPSSLDTSIASALQRPSFLPPPPRTAFASLALVPKPPPSLPKPLYALWEYLYTMPLIDNDTVRFLNTKKPAPRTIPIPEYDPVHGRRRRGPIDGGPSIGETDVGGWWDWVVVCEVSGKGAGEVLRTEGALREWISRNPITLNGTSRVSEKVKKVSKSEPATEWGLIDTECGLVVHVMTPAARQRWRVEGIWAN